jgi:hypothetical protein
MTKEIFLKSTTPNQIIYTLILDIYLLLFLLLDSKYLSFNKTGNNNNNNNNNNLAWKNKTIISARFI